MSIIAAGMLPEASQERDTSAEWSDTIEYRDGSDIKERSSTDVIHIDRRIRSPKQKLNPSQIIRLQFHILIRSFLFC